LTPEETAMLVWDTIQNPKRNEIRRTRARTTIRMAKDPAAYVLAVGLALGVLMNNPVKGYHELRKLLNEKEIKQVPIGSGGYHLKGQPTR